MVSFEEFEKNFKEGIIKEKEQDWVTELKFNENLKLRYMTWTKVWQWMKKNYPKFIFKVEEIQPKEYVIASLWIDEETYGRISLNLEYTEKIDKKTGIKKEIKETPEKVQMRVFVKLVANLTGFGFHLWKD